MPKPNGDYPIGFDRPPKKHQFKPGQSGNPRGRPRKEINYDAMFERELMRKIPIVENGRSKRVTKLEGIVRVYLQRALKGEVRVIMDILSSARSLCVKMEMEANRDSRDRFVYFVG